MVNSIPTSWRRLRNRASNLTGTGIRVFGCEKSSRLTLFFLACPQVPKYLFRRSIGTSSPPADIIRHIPFCLRPIKPCHRTLAQVGIPLATPVLPLSFLLFFFPFFFPSQRAPFPYRQDLFTTSRTSRSFTRAQSESPEQPFFASSTCKKKPYGVLLDRRCSHFLASKIACSVALHALIHQNHDMTTAQSTCNCRYLTNPCCYRV